MNKIHIKHSYLLIIILTLISCSTDDEQVPGDTTSSTIWKGSKITFSKADGADHTQANNQDKLTSNVFITRANDGGQIFNIIKESAANKNSSPAGTTCQLVLLTILIVYHLRILGRQLANLKMLLVKVW